MTEEVEKAIKALEAAFRKAQRAGIQVKGVYTHTDENRVTRTERLGK